MMIVGAQSKKTGSRMTGHLVLALSLLLQSSTYTFCTLPVSAQNAPPPPSPAPVGKPVLAPVTAPPINKVNAGTNQNANANLNGPTRISRPHQPTPAPITPAATAPAQPQSTRITRPGALQMQTPSVDTIPPAASSTPPSTVNTGGGNKNAAAPNAVPQRGVMGDDAYPAIGKLEEVTLGHRQPGLPITERLSTLETVVFKRHFSDDSLFDRTERLKKTILGAIEPGPAAMPSVLDSPDVVNPPIGGTQGLETAQEIHYLDDLASRPENLMPSTPEQVGQYAVELINTERRNYGLSPVSPDNVAEKLAFDQVKDQAARNALSHFSVSGLGPDRRYTLVEGSDALTECIASVKASDMGGNKVCKAGAARLLKILLSRQDDRDAILSPDATHIGFGVAMSSSGERMLACAEVLTRHALMGPLPAEAKLGDKLEVKGVLNSPYSFDRITVAWEAFSPDGQPAGDDMEEALPYFPPLDYIAFASHSEQNHDKAIVALKAVGMVAAIAGGFFIPPVALAAPLIAVAGTPSETRPVSDIPVKGGVHMEGAQFTAKIPLSNANKEGLYYITVWGTLGRGQKSIPISRRVILVKQQEVTTDIKGEVESDSKRAELDRKAKELDKKAKEQERKDKEKADKEKAKQEKEQAKRDKEQAKNEAEQKEKEKDKND